MDWLAQAHKLEAEGKIGTAIDLLERAVASGEEDAILCKEIARMCLTVNEVRAFANWCHEAIRLNPKDGEPYLMMGRQLSSRNRWMETVEAMEEALSRGALTPSQVQEAQAMLATARDNHAAWKKAHPGTSNL